MRCCLPLAADDAPAAPHRVRLLTAQASVGIVLGKRGATVSQLRQETGASIKVLPTEPVPPAFGGSIGGGEDCDTGAWRGGQTGCRVAWQLVLVCCWPWRTAQNTWLPCSGTSLLLLLFHAPSFCTHRLAAEMGSISSGMSTGGRSSLGGSEEVIQIEGTVQQCVAALRGVATLLRGWQIRRVMTMQQGAMAMQQGGYGPGFGPPPMPMAQQVPMSPTSTSGAPMSPTSPGAPVAVAVAGPAFWVSSACGYRWQEAICAPDCKPSCLRLQIHVPPLSCPCRHPATQHAAEPGADRGLHPHGCQHAAAWHAAAQRRPAEAHLQLHVPPEQYPGGSLGAVPLCHGARCGG